MDPAPACLWLQACRGQGHTRAGAGPLTCCSLASAAFRAAKFWPLKPVWALVKQSSCC